MRVRGKYKSGDVFDIRVSYWAYMDAFKRFGDMVHKLEFWKFIEQHQDNHGSLLARTIVDLWGSIVFIRAT
jgi:hypothetical protein